MGPEIKEVTGTEVEPKTELPNLHQAHANFKAQLRTLSKNDLVRQATDFYMRLVIAYAQIEQLNKELQKSSESKES